MKTTPLMALCATVALVAYSLGLSSSSATTQVAGPIQPSLSRNQPGASAPLPRELEELLPKDLQGGPSRPASASPIVAPNYTQEILYSYSYRFSKPFYLGATGTLLHHQQIVVGYDNFSRPIMTDGVTFPIVTDTIHAVFAKLDNAGLVFVMGTPRQDQTIISNRLLLSMEHDGPDLYLWYYEDSRITSLQTQVFLKLSPKKDPPSAPRSRYVFTGSYVGDGKDDRSITGLGFKPSYVMISATDTFPSVWRFESMPSGKSKMVGGTYHFIDNLIQAFEADGFQIGNGREVNVRGTTYYFRAHR